MKIILASFLSLFVYCIGFSQNDDKIYVKLDRSGYVYSVEMIIPYGDAFLYEKYDKFITGYTLSTQDTLIKKNNVLIGSIVDVDLKDDYYKLGYCDTKIVSEVRNSALYFKSKRMLKDSTVLHIGEENKKFKAKTAHMYFIQNTVNNTCHDNFKELNTTRFNTVLKIIYHIRDEKNERLIKVKNADKIVASDISDFLSDYNHCAIDNELAKNIIIKNPERFAEIFEDLSEDEFDDFLDFVSDFNKDVNTKKAIETLKNIDKPSKRTKVLLKRLKKTKEVLKFKV